MVRSRTNTCTHVTLRGGVPVLAASDGRRNHCESAVEPLRRLPRLHVADGRENDQQVAEITDEGQHQLLPRAVRQGRGLAEVDEEVLTYEVTADMIQMFKLDTKGNLLERVDI